MKALKRRRLTLPPPHHRPGSEELFHAPGEAPAVYSIRVTQQHPGGAALGAALEQCVAALRDWAVSERFLIGHIKVFAENDAKDHLWLATTGKGIQVQASPGWPEAPSGAFQLHFTAIIFGPDQARLREVAGQWIDLYLMNY